LKIPASELALRIPIQVGPTAEAFYDRRGYAMPTEAAACRQAEHERFIAKGQIPRLPEHRAAHLSAVAGKGGSLQPFRQEIDLPITSLNTSPKRSFTMRLSRSER
jgi:hypothetical protein